MTNPKTRKTGKARTSSNQQVDYDDPQHNAISRRVQINSVLPADDIEPGSAMSNWIQRHIENESSSVDDENRIMSIASIAEEGLDDDDDDDGEDEEMDSCSSFSLQECIDEFRERRIRRLSTQSREGIMEERADNPRGKDILDQEDVDLINQNRSNKEHERKYKPCENGFCYCFTSDSGDGGCNATRGGHVRPPRRHRKSESGQIAYAAPQHNFNKPKEKRRKSAPANLKETQKAHIHESINKKQISFTTDDRLPLTAVSSLETASADAPLIHIIQELHNNCVISEVRVNKHKVHGYQNGIGVPTVQSHSTQTTSKNTPYSLNTELHSPQKTLTIQKRSPSKYIPQQRPTAPPLEEIAEIQTHSGRFIYTSPLETSCKSGESENLRKHKGCGGRLLRKRLSQSNIQFKPRNLNQPPPKPPRSSVSLEAMSSLSSLASTTPSVREAERILDEFLQKRGYQTISEEKQKARNNRAERNAVVPVNSSIVKQRVAAGQREVRKSYPLTTKQYKDDLLKPLPSYPSLNDLQKELSENNYGKNIRRVIEKPIKELSFGWTEPKIVDMLNYDTNANRREFKSQATQAEPQTIGWQVPHKVNLDTVDGTVRGNLESNIASKNTPVKSQIFGTPAGKGDSQKFIWHEQLRNLSPWTAQKHGNRKLKSSLKSSSCAFLSNSRKKILRLVSPKKYNDHVDGRRTSSRSIGVQTSQEACHCSPYELSSTTTPLQSPPGSYHSAVQTSQDSSTTPSRSNNNQNGETQFDFTRIIHSPPKKAPRASSQRKLNFPLNCGAGACDTSAVSDRHAMAETYRSYQSDLDQDVALSKMGYILSNIRARLEASDEHAVRTFREIEQQDRSLGVGRDCTDGRRVCAETHVTAHRNANSNHFQMDQHEPIYSEIEEDSIHISGSPHHDNKTGIDHFSAAHNPAALYAKIRKPPRNQRTSMASTRCQPPTAFGKIILDSLQNIAEIPLLMPSLPALPESDSSGSSEISYAAPESAVIKAAPPQVHHSQSLNNIRVMEQDSPPKRNRNLSKSDLSLHRSEIFLENLCCSEIIVKSEDKLSRSQKVENVGKLAQDEFSPSNATNDEAGSYELPHDDATVGSNCGLNAINPPEAHNQSTPKNQTNIAPQTTFMTKSLKRAIQPTKYDLNVDVHAINICTPHSSSCPVTPQKASERISMEDEHTKSFNEIATYAKINAKAGNGENTSNNSVDANAKTISANTVTHYKRLKDALRKSLRKSKKFVKAETKRLSSSLILPSTINMGASSNDIQNQTDARLCDTVTTSSSLNLDTIFALNEPHIPVTEQLVKAVSICRQLPDLEISPEMVEAERLLLYSSLRRQSQNKLGRTQPRAIGKSQYIQRFFVDAMRLPVKANPSQDIFFNYFYICTFECDGIIKSSQSVECRNHEVIFHDCGIEFECDSVNMIGKVSCKLFMLRLRKVSTLSLEPRKTIVKIPNVATSSPTQSASSSSSSSCEEIVSRFRLQASFSITPMHFVPFEYVESISKNSDRLCLRAARTCNISIHSCAKSTNLSGDIIINGRAEIRFAKQSHSGFLNVQDPHTLHNWNRRWCTLEGLHMYIWQDMNEIKEQPLLSLNLCDINKHTTEQVTIAPRELCARPRSFCLQSAIHKADEEIATAAVFFAAETQDDLNAWLQHINSVFVFVATWMPS